MRQRITVLFLIVITLCQPLHPAGKADTGHTPILGESMVDAEHMWRFVSAENADFPQELAQHYYDIGKTYGIRGDIALCQAIIETGWFKFDRGTAVTPDQHNYCGLGVLKRGMTGHSFSSPRDGVTAQIQHLYAYATKDPLPEGEIKLDKRFELVERGCAATWEDLSGRWAANSHYAKDILRLFNRMLTSANQNIEEEVLNESFSDRMKLSRNEITDTTVTSEDNVTVEKSNAIASGSTLETHGISICRRIDAPRKIGYSGNVRVKRRKR